MKLNKLFALTLMGLYAGCTSSTGTHSQSAAASEEKSCSTSKFETKCEKVSYEVFKNNGRIYLISTEKTKAAFNEHGHLAISKSFIGAGANGETVVVEVCKEDADLADNIWNQYEKDELSYFEADIKGRTYIVGSVDSYKKLKVDKHLPICKSYIGAGRNGQTVVVEVKKDDADFAEMLWQQYSDKHLSYFEADYNGRTYIVGSMDSYKKLKEDKHLPICKSYIGAGRNGQTVVVEVKKDDADFAEMLWQQYSDKHLSYFEKEYKGRTYVVGSMDSYKKLKVDKHLPICKSFIGAGHKGQTVVVEVKKDDAEFADSLWLAYQSKYKMN